MKSSVVIKSTRYGLQVQLNPEEPFETLCEEVFTKFKESARFFKGAHMAATFLGRKLTMDEEHTLIDLISDAADVKIVCLVEENEQLDNVYKRFINESMDIKDKKEGQFYRGNLRWKQVLESDSSIIIIGNVEAGAKVISKGNIVVLGSIKGKVHAGAGGDKNAFIAGLSFRPKYLKIGDVEAHNSLLQHQANFSTTPKIAVLDGEHIYIDPLE